MAVRSTMKLMSMPWIGLAVGLLFLSTSSSTTVTINQITTTEPKAVTDATTKETDTTAAITTITITSMKPTPTSNLTKNPAPTPTLASTSTTTTTTNTIDNNASTSMINTSATAESSSILSSSTTTSAITPTSVTTEPTSSKEVITPTNPTSTSIASTTSAMNYTDVALGVGIGGGLLVLIVVIIVVILIWRLKRPDKPAGSERFSTLQVGGYHNPAFDKEDAPEVLMSAPVLEPQIVPVKDLLTYVANHQTTTLTDYKKEFGSLPPPRIKSFKDANEKENRPKNRYINILPFDEDRVVLSSSTDFESDYVNASYIDGYNTKKAYIATQGPLTETFVDFWKMIWEQNSCKIIMVANLLEDNKPKCDQYWPAMESGDSTISYGNITVKTTEEKDLGDYIVRTFQVQKGFESRVVYQFHFTSWPDQEIPDNCTAVLKFMHHCFKTDLQGDLKGPAIVHCSAGVGRTGTLIGIDILLDQAKHEARVDFVKCIEKLRRHRMSMVQTLVQYMFIHHAVLESLIVGKIAIPASHLQMNYSDMTKTGPNGKTGIQIQFEVLDVLKPKCSQNWSYKATIPENKAKNRSSKMLPADSYTPYLRPAPGEERGENEDYINAVFVHGYQRQLAYIATQTPMESTAKDFWKLVKDYNCSTIVMLNDIPDHERQYWPEDGRTTQSGQYVVTNTGEMSSDDIIITDLQIKTTMSDGNKDESKSEQMYANASEIASIYPPAEFVDKTEPLYSNSLEQQKLLPENSFSVRHIRLLNWPNNGALPKEKSTLLSLHAEVVRCQDRNPDGHTLVHCLHGAERSGIFCALMNMMDAIKRQEEVDVFNSVKRIRRTRPEFIPTIEQYSYLYDLAIQQVSSTESDYMNLRQF